VALVDGIGFADVSVWAPPGVDGEGGGVDEVGGTAGDGVAAVAGVADDGVDCASVVGALDDVGAAGFDVVAHAAPAIVMIAAALAVATFPSREFIATLLSFEGRRTPPMSAG
jgi:hypothetical protein